jgi:hypothetical protein
VSAASASPPSINRYILNYDSKTLQTSTWQQKLRACGFELTIALPTALAKGVRCVSLREDSNFQSSD